MSKQLPSHPNLENLKKQAKQLVKDHKAGQVEAFMRIKASFPRLANASVQEILSDDFSLCHAQLVIAREYGFADWQALSDAVTMLASDVLSDTLMGDHPSLRWVQGQMVQMASTDLPMVIAGEAGTGKGLVARTIHRLSGRKNGPFFQVACGTTPDVLVASDLFGHEKGAFTGAHVQKLGKVEVAQGGVLFLDEVGDLSLSVQEKLVRLLETGSFERVGGIEVMQADVRVIGATQRDLQALVAAGTFRQDLVFLLAKMTLRMPSLRERRADIPELAQHFIGQMATHLNKTVSTLSPDVVAALQAYDWPGNVQELAHRVQRAVVDCQAAAIQRGDIVLG